PTVVVYTHPDIPSDAACDTHFSADLPRMCNLDSTIYWPVGYGTGLDLSDAADVPGAYLWDLAYIYTNPVAWNSSVAFYYLSMRDGLEDTDEERFVEAWRRDSLQDQCWAAAMSMQVPSASEPSKTLREALIDPSRWSEGEPPETIRPEIGWAWIERGFESAGDLSACNTWAADVDEVTCPLSPRGLPEPHAVQAACGGPADGAAAPNSCAPGTATRHAGHWRMPGRPPILLIHGIRIDGGRVGGPGIRRADREGDRARPAPRGAGDPRAERPFGGAPRPEHALLRLDRLRPAPGAPARRAGPLPPGGDDDPLPDRRARGRPAPGGPELPGRHPGVGPWPRPGGGARLPGHGTGDRHRLAHRGDAGAGCALRGRVPGRTSARRGLDPLGRAAAAVGGDPAGPQRRRVLPQRLVRDGAGGGAVPAPAGAGRRLDGRGRRGVARRAPDRPAGPRGLSTRSPRAA